jgi:hypothetical protein
VARRIGERAADRYIKHPAASTSNPLSEGWAIDAGTVQLYQSNAHVLARESLRHLATIVGPFDVPDYTSRDAQWGPPYVAAIPNDTGSSHGGIPWSRHTAVRSGPHFGVQDYALEDNRRVLRPVRMAISITIDAGASTRFLYAAMTPTEAPPPARDYLAFDSVSVATGTTYTVFELVPMAPVPPAAPFRCRPDNIYPGLRAASTVQAAPFYLWWGWQILNGGSGTSVNALSAWEWSE